MKAVHLYGRFCEEKSDFLLSHFKINNQPQEKSFGFFASRLRLYCSNTNTIIITYKRGQVIKVSTINKKLLTFGWELELCHLVVTSSCGDSLHLQ